jgi:hypothetical protein
VKPSKRPKLRWFFFILRTLVIYPAVGIIVGITMAMIPMWFSPSEVTKAFGGEVWRDQQRLQAAYVGAVLFGMCAFFGLLFGLLGAVARITVPLILVVLERHKEKASRAP